MTRGDHAATYTTVIHCVGHHYTGRMAEHNSNHQELPLEMESCKRLGRRGRDKICGVDPCSNHPGIKDHSFWIRIAEPLVDDGQLTPVTMLMYTENGGEPRARSEG